MENPTGTGVDRKILDKITKLYNLQKSAEEIGSLAEAENAAAKMQALLLEHNLSTFDVGSHKLTGDKKVEIGKSSKVNFDDEKTGRPGGKWMLDLLNILAWNNFCDVIYWNRTKQAVVIGTPTNMEAVLYFHSYFSNLLPQMALKAWKSQETGFFYEKNRYKYMRHYCTGAVMGIGTKLSQERIKAEQANNSVTGLVLYNKEQLKAYMNEAFPGTKERKAREVKWSDATVKGYNEGRQVNMVKGVEGGDLKSPGLLK